MKVANSGLQHLNLTSIEEQLDKLPETIAQAPDLNVVANQGQEQSTAKSESAKVSSAAQEALIRSELELKYTKPNSGSETTQSTGEKTLNDSQRKAAEEALGDPMERLPQEENNSSDQATSKSKPDFGRIGSVYGDGTPNSTVGRGGASSFTDPGGGSGRESSVSSGERMTPEQKAKFAEMAGFNQGPDSATSKMEDVNSRVPEGGTDKRDAAIRGIIDSANPFTRVNDPTSSNSGPGSSDRGDKYGGTGMISQGAAYGGFVGYDESEGVQNRGSGQMAKDYPGLAKVSKETFINGGVNSPRGEALAEAEAELERTSSGSQPKETAPTNTDEGKDEKTYVGTKDDGTKVVMRPDGTRTELKTNGDWADYDANGKKTDSGSVQDTEQDEASRGKAARQKLGFDLVNLPKAPKTSGDVDPTEDGSEIEYGGKINSAISQQGKNGLIGQPVDRVTEGGSPSGNFSMGGDVDFENKSGWTGREITEEPGDLPLPGQQEAPPPRSTQQEEEESDQKTKSALSAQLALNLHRANQIRMKG
jgi:hypothetical protein